MITTCPPRGYTDSFEIHPSKYLLAWRVAILGRCSKPFRTPAHSFEQRLFRGNKVCRVAFRHQLRTPPRHVELDRRNQPLAIQGGLIDLLGGRAYGDSLPGLGINSDQRYPAHSAAADSHHMAASPQVG